MPQYQGVWNLAQQAQALTSQRWVTDSLYNYTTLLLQADGIVNGSQNNTFIDSSNNYFPITRNGNTTQGTFSPFSATGWSTYLLGGNGESSSSSIQVVNYPASADFDFTGSNVATIECWFYYTTLGVRQTIISFRGTGNPSFQSLAVSSGGYLAINWDIVSVPTNGGSISTTYVTPNQWHHLAYVRNASANKFYLDGIDVTSTFANPSGSGFWPYDTSPSLYIGADWYNAFGNAYFAGFLGYISNLRVTRSAVYTANFTPSPFPLTTTSQGVTAGNVKLLTFQSNRFVDNSSSAKTATLVNSPSIQAFSPFAPQFQYTPTVTGGSGYFDGTGDYLTYPVSQTPLLFGNSDFTIEAWVYRVSGTGTCSVMNGQSDLTTAGGSSFVLYLSSTATSDVYIGGSGFGVTSPNPTLGQWAHVAMVRTGGTLSTYLNGSRVGTRSDLGTGSVNNGSTANVGAIGGFSNNSNILNGYMSGLRVIKGSGGYNATSATIPIPTALPTAITNTQLLLNFTNAGIYDATLKNNLETVGNAQISTSVVKYGSGSMFFDGTGDSLQAPNSQLLQFGNGDFTVEFWANTNSFGSQTYTPICGIWNANVPSDSNSSWYVTINAFSSTLRLGLSYRSGGATTDLSFGTVTNGTGTWDHYAVVRSGNLLYGFKNGVLLNAGGTAITATIATGGTTPFLVGAIQNGNQYNGYIDDLRITKGIARYTRNFTPPQVALPRQ